MSSSPSIENKLTTFSRGYLAALRKHLEHDPAPSLGKASGLGRRAVNLGLETLDLATIHQAAMITLVAPHDSSRARGTMVRRGRAFFAESIAAIEGTHRGATEANAHLKIMVETLTKRTVELAVSNDELTQRTMELGASNEALKHEIVQRKAVEDSLRTSELTSSQLLEQARDMQMELRNLSRRLLSAQEEEQKRISRELHDVIAQALTAINVRLANLKSNTTTNVRDLDKQIASTQRLVEKSVDIVHRFARDLRPTMLDDLGLIPALHSYMKGFLEQTGIRVGLTAFAGVEKLESGSRMALYRVAQEALTNVARHAQASHANVSIHNRNGAVCMEITDNGIGFQVEGVAFAKSSNRLGLLGMRERVEMVGGTFCVDSEPGKATTIRVEIPLASRSTKKRTPKKSGNAPHKRP